MSICLKVVLKKSKQFLLLLIVLTAGVSLFPQEIHVESLNRDGGMILLNCRILLSDTEQLLSALDAGNRVRIGIRLREDSPTVSLLTPRARQFEYQREVSWDPVERLYVIEEQDGERRFFPHKDALLDTVLSFKKLPVTINSGEHSFRLRGEIQWKILIPPLNILSPFLPKLHARTQWKQVGILQPGCCSGDRET